MSKRHVVRQGDLESIFGRLQELVLANSGEDDFEEIFKLLIAKLFTEIYSQYHFNFHIYSSPGETTQNINMLLAEANKKWKGILFGPPKSSLSDEHLAVCVEALQDHPLLDTSLEVLDAAFEYLVNNAAKGAKGQYFTPRHIIDCCVQIIDPLPHEVVLDPACGSAGFLIHTLNYVKKTNPLSDISEYCQNNLWGCDFDHRAIRVARALMLIASDGNGNLYRLNSLVQPNPEIHLFDTSSPDCKNAIPTIEEIFGWRFPDFKGVDIILTNPPFAGEVKEPGLLQGYELAKHKHQIERDILFLERCIKLLKPGGRLAIILPHNKLSANSLAYIREWLVCHLRIVAVLGLGRNTFLPHTHQKAGVIFGVKREKPVSLPSDESIAFLISERDGKDSRGQIVPLPNTSINDPAWMRADHDLGELVTYFHNFVKSSDIRWGGINGTVYSRQS